MADTTTTASIGVLPSKKLPDWWSVAQALDHVIVKDLQWEHNPATNSVLFGVRPITDKEDGKEEDEVKCIETTKQEGEYMQEKEKEVAAAPPPSAHASGSGSSSPSPPPLSNVVVVATTQLQPKPGRRQPGQGAGSLLCVSGEMYTGEYLDRKPHGHGSLLYPDSSRYDGHFEHGFFAGEGRYQQFPYDTERRTAYEGEWQAGKPHGTGTATFLGGKVTYEGSWEEGRPHGVGVLTDCRFSAFNQPPYRYKGPWQRGEEHGMDGEESFPDGASYLGGFMEGRRHGYGVLRSGDGTYEYRGQWLNGRRHGRGVEKTPNGDVYDGGFFKDQRKGQGKITYPDGTVFEDFFTAPKISYAYSIRKTGP